MFADDRYRRAAAAGGVGIWDWNLVTNEVYVDPVLRQILGYEEGEIGNHMDDWRGLVHPDDSAAVFGRVQAVVAGETPFYESEHRMLHRDGTVRWFLVRGSVTRDASGRAVSMAGTDIDITERKRGEEALRQAEELNRRIAEHTGDCVKILDLEGRLVYMNREGLRVLEVEAAHVLNRPIVDFFNGQIVPALRAAGLSTAQVAGLTQVFTTNITQNTQIDAVSVQAGFHYRVGPGRIMASWAKQNDKRPSNSDATLLAVGYDYNLSKRTDIYTVFAHIKNQNEGQFTPGVAGGPGGFTKVPGEDSHAVQLGIRHRF